MQRLRCFHCTSTGLYPAGNRFSPTSPGGKGDLSDHPLYWKHILACGRPWISSDTWGLLNPNIAAPDCILHHFSCSGLKNLPISSSAFCNFKSIFLQQADGELPSMGISLFVVTRKRGIIHMPRFLSTSILYSTATTSASFIIANLHTAV